MTDAQAIQIVHDVLGLLRSKELRFPSPPTVVVKLNQIVNDDFSTLNDVVQVVQTHPVLSARLLQVANSAALKRGKDVKTVHDAVARLGSGFVRNLALSLSLREKFNPSNPLVLQVVADIWSHSAKIGALSLLMADLLCERNLLKIDPNIALVTGVIHAVGEIPLVDYAMKHDYRPQVVMNLAPELKTELTVGMLEAWELPQEFIDAMLFKGTYGAVLRYVHDFLDGKMMSDLVEGLVALPYDDFERYMIKHEDKVHDIVATFA